jgi:flavodoxin I
MVSIIALALAVSISKTADAFLVLPKVGHARTALEMASSVGIYYSTSTGNTETVAGYIAEAAGLEGKLVNDIGDATDAEILGHDALIVGAPTWHTGADEQRSGTSWDEWLYDTLPNLDVTGKKVAIFGVGDQESYGDNFCDAAGELFDLFSAKGCKIYGLTSQDGYGHIESKAIKDGKFCG